MDNCSTEKYVIRQGAIPELRYSGGSLCIYKHVYLPMSALYFSTFHPVFFPHNFLFLSRTSRHRGCHVEKGKRERGRNVLPKCLFARLSGIWSPWELILLRLRLICFLCCLLKVITSCLEIYKRTAQGESPPKGGGTEWKISHTSGQCRWDTADLCTGVSELCVWCAWKTRPTRMCTRHVFLHKCAIPGVFRFENGSYCSWRGLCGLLCCADVSVRVCGELR